MRSGSKNGSQRCGPSGRIDLSEAKPSTGSEPPRNNPLGEHEPGWAAGLRKLYNSVVEEPLPDSFDDLLKQLDEAPASKRDTGGGDDAP